MPHTKTAPSDLTSDDLEHFRVTLEAKREEVYALYRHDVQVGQESTDDNADDFADRANNSYNRETMFALSDTERTLLFEIDEALLRIENGTYGQCEHSGVQIGIERLRALPWARYCIESQELKERGLLD
ncbi:MAG: TraR/DksA family transcriptional regulator [Acidobacteriota bacterium]